MSQSRPPLQPLLRFSLRRATYGPLGGRRASAKAQCSIRAIAIAPGKGRVQKMFPRIKLARSMKLRVTPDEGSIGFEGMVGHTAAVHHHGREKFVVRAPNGTSVRTRYPRRRLLDFAGEDIEMVGDVVLALLEK